MEQGKSLLSAIAHGSALPDNADNAYTDAAMQFLWQLCPTKPECCVQTPVEETLARIYHLVDGS